MSLFQIAKKGCTMLWCCSSVIRSICRQCTVYTFARNILACNWTCRNELHQNSNQNNFHLRKYVNTKFPSTKWRLECVKEGKMWTVYIYINRRSMDRQGIPWTPYGLSWFCLNRGTSFMVKYHTELLSYKRSKIFLWRDIYVICLTFASISLLLQWII